MPAYVLLLRLTDQGIRNVQKLPDALDLNAQGIGPLMGVQIKQFFVTVGRYDAVALVEAKSDEHLAQFALTVAGFGNVRTESLRAFGDSEFRELIGKMV